ncbi:MAG: hypothetical protein WC565_10470 [Parcubacteria group bacterium]|jgi:hypothetical protein
MLKDYEALHKAARELIEYIEEVDLCDAGDDDGDGYIDERRTKNFSDLIEAVKKAL